MQNLEVNTRANQFTHAFDQLCKLIVQVFYTFITASIRKTHYQPGVKRNTSHNY